MNDPIFQETLNKATNFELRRAIERLREGLFDPFGVQLLTAGEDPLKKVFNNGLNVKKNGMAAHLCICGAYGQGKSHSLTYLQRMAQDDGFVCSYINIDPREIPFHNFDLVYRELMRSIKFPNGETSFIKVWKKWVKDQLNSVLNKDYLNLDKDSSNLDKELSKKDGSKEYKKNCLDLIPKKILDQIPHRFKAILTALVQPTIAIPKNKKHLKKHLKFTPREFPDLLKRAMMGENIPSYRLNPVFRYREVDFYKQGSMLCKGSEPYLDMIQALSAIFVKMGYKGWVVLFDEAESITQTRITIRAKSYELFDKILNHQAASNLYPIFAFTDDFFMHLEQEEYDRIKLIKTETNEKILYFEKNYHIAWRNLNIHRLQDISSKEWKKLIKKLIFLHSSAYQWQPDTKKLSLKMVKVLLKKQTQEPRLTFKTLIRLLDIENQTQVLGQKLGQKT